MRQILLIVAAHTSALLFDFEHHITGLTAPLIKLLSFARRLALSEVGIAIQSLQLSLVDRTALAEKSLHSQHMHSETLTTQRRPRWRSIAMVRTAREVALSRVGGIAGAAMPLPLMSKMVNFAQPASSGTSITI